jgi:uncharacterized protein YegP (UPF0339 family)
MTSKWLRGVLGGTALVVLLSAVPVLAQKDKGKTTFEVYKDAKKEWRWRYKDGDTVIATPGQGYKAKTAATKAIESIQSSVDKLDVEFYRDAKEEHRWRLKAKNGNIVAVSSVGYKSKADAQKAFETLKKGAKAAKVVEEKKDK